MANDHRLETTLDLYSKVEALVAGTATLAKRLDFSVLLLSVLTSGSLWLLDQPSPSEVRSLVWCDCKHVDDRYHTLHEHDRHKSHAIAGACSSRASREAARQCSGWFDRGQRFLE